MFVVYGSYARIWKDIKSDGIVTEKVIRWYRSNTLRPEFSGFFRFLIQEVTLLVEDPPLRDYVPLEGEQVELESDMISSHPLDNNIEFPPFIDSQRSGFNLTR